MPRPRAAAPHPRGKPMARWGCPSDTKSPWPPDPTQRMARNPCPGTHRAPRAARGRLQVPHRVHRTAVDAGLEVDVRAEAMARATRGGDDLPGPDVLADGDAERRVVPVTGG